MTCLREWHQLLFWGRSWLTDTPGPYLGLHAVVLTVGPQILAGLRGLDAGRVEDPLQLLLLALLQADDDAAGLLLFLWRQEPSFRNGKVSPTSPNPSLLIFLSSPLSKRPACRVTT